MQDLKEKEKRQTQTTMDRQFNSIQIYSNVNINEDIASLGLTLRGTNGHDKGPRTMEVIPSYPSPLNGWR